MPVRRLFCVLLAFLLLASPALADVRLPEALEIIAPYAFYGDESLTDVTLPEGIREIRAKAFADSALQRINLPSSLTFIDSSAFDGCEGLTLHVPDNSYPLVWARAKGAFEYVIEEGYTSQYGSLSGVVTDGGSAVEGAGVSLRQGWRVVASAQTDANGGYFFTSIPEGTYDIRVIVDGRAEFRGQVEIYGGESVYYDPIGLFEGETAGTGTVTGCVTNAFTGAAVSGARVTVRAGWGAQTGAVVAEALTDAGGNYSFDLEAGYYTVTAAVDGCVLSSANVCVRPDATAAGQNIAALPQAAEDEFRVKLTWGQDPRDLDAHVKGSAFHVYYSSKSASADGQTLCNLDVDDTTSFGPEVVTLKAAGNEPYYYYVHHYAGEGTLAASNACIEVYKGSHRLKTYRVPAHGGEGKYWNVFCIQNGRVITKDTITEEPDTSYREDTEAADEGGPLTWLDGTTVREEVDVPNNGLFTDFSFLSDNPWMISVPDWIAVSPISGAGGKHTVKVGVAKNLETEREGDMLISSTGVNPLVVHFTQEAGAAEIAFALDFDRQLTEDGWTHVTATVEVSDKDDGNIFTGENIVLKPRFDASVETRNLPDEISFEHIMEGRLQQFSFDVLCRPTAYQLRQLEAGDDVRDHTVRLRFDITSDNAGNYEYTHTLNARPATTRDISFSVFLADSVIDERSRFLSDLYDYVPPYSGFIAPLQESEKFQSALTEWREKTFTVSSEMEYAEEELDYYRALIYAILYDEGGDPRTGSKRGTIDTLNDINDFYEGATRIDDSIGAINSVILSGETGADSLAKQGFMKFLSDVSLRKAAGTLDARYEKYVPVARVVNTFGLASKLIGGAVTVLEIMDRVEQIQYFTEITDQKRAVLEGVRNQDPDNVCLRVAIGEYLDIYPAVSDNVIRAIMIGEETAYGLLRLAGDAAYGIYATVLPLSALTQAEGTLLADWLFNTSEIVKAYYECAESTRLENAIKPQVVVAYETFIEHPDSDEAALQLLAAVDVFYRNRCQGVMAADRFAKASLTDQESITILNDQVEVPVNVIKRAIKRILNSDATETYNQINALLTLQWQQSHSFLTSMRSEATMNYYDTTRLIQIKRPQLQRQY